LRFFDSNAKIMFPCLNKMRWTQWFAWSSPFSLFYWKL